ncbi:hypothetical protein BUALT_Bualt11G0022400 [Buddleja alternifolia]|uniref:ZF-HD dimerization-type domain-containing protein n=1 Tax=Buddleja alternifolia TaxID=168488 RepID=A0AAV6X2K2_9LAMI|nr:hypothetical protein BUALT_Bualt11G0022400 [Buddleja alternifolia]
MEFEDQEEEQEGEVGLGPSYNDSLGNSNSTRPIKMPSPVDIAAAPPPPPLRKSRYKECQKNHAVGIGAHAVDGCGEFIAAGEDGTLESLKCAACNCHRNFHRKESEPSSGGASFAFHQHSQQQILLPHRHNPQGHFGYRTPSGYLHLAPPPHQRAALLALPSSSGGGGGSGEDLEDYYSNPSSSGGIGKKRFRTKFTQEQKDKMLNFAERLGWRIQKQDEEIVQQMCNELGIKRHVLKVWMHNNKHTLGKKITT